MNISMLKWWHRADRWDRLLVVLMVAFGLTTVAGVTRLSSGTDTTYVAAYGGGLAFFLCLRVLTDRAVSREARRRRDMKEQFDRARAAIAQRHGLKEDAYALFLQCTGSMNGSCVWGEHFDTALTLLQQGVSLAAFREVRAAYRHIYTKSDGSSAGSLAVQPNGI